MSQFRVPTELFLRTFARAFRTRPSLQPWLAGTIRQASSQSPNPTSRGLLFSAPPRKRCSTRSAILRQLRFRRHNGSSTNPNPTPNLGSPKPALSFSQRMRKLSREYGWSALGVYLALSALDFPFCFLAVRTLGTDRIGHWEHVIVTHVKDLVPESVQEAVRTYWPLGKGKQVAGVEDWGVEAADKANTASNASIWTQLALAYAVHKSFIFLRVPLTAAVTPKVVKVLRGWGWDIGKRKPKVPKPPKA